MIRDLSSLMLILLFLGHDLHSQEVSIPERNLSFQNLQEAIDSARAHEHVILSEGIYQSNQTINVFKDDLIIEGRGHVEVICTSKEENVFWLTGERITVRNVHARHTEPEEYAHCTGNVFAVDVCYDCVIENCDINGCGRIGVYMFGSKGLILRNNHIHKNSLYAVDINGIGVLKATNEFPDLVKFEDNKIHHNGPSKKEKKAMRRWMKGKGEMHE